jgi:hypothetical protein
MSNSAKINKNDEVIDIVEVFKFFWNTKSFTIFITLIASIFSIFISLNIQNIYISDSLLSAVDDEGSGLEKMVSQYGALAGLAGIDVGSSSGKIDASDEAIALLKSRHFIGNFIKKRNLLIPVMASHSLDKDMNVLYDPKIYDNSNGKWTRNPPPNRDAIPSYQEAAELFIKEQIIVTKDTSAGFISISIKNISPINAQQWSIWLVEDLNNYFREYDRSLAEKSINFLNEQVSTTKISNIKEIFHRLIEDQTRKLMFVESREEYKFKVVIPPHKPEVKSYPKRSVLCILGAILGAFIAIFISFILYLNNLKISFSFSPRVFKLVKYDVL